MMKNRSRRIHLRVILAIAAIVSYSTGCGTVPSTQGAATIPLTSTSTEPVTLTQILPTGTPIATRTPSIATATVESMPTSAGKEGWLDFINGYYGYAISLPSSAVVTKNAEIMSAPAEALPPTPENSKGLESPFDQLNRTYPPGICVSIEYQFVLIQIRVADELGGIYADMCGNSGGMGVGNWVWTEEELAVGAKTYPATVLRRYDSDAPDAKLSSELYMADLGDGARFSINGRLTDPVLLEILRSYRSVPRTELFCPEPAPTHLKPRGYAYVSSDPPLIDNNVRSGPGINQDLIGSIAPGTSVELLQGPVCNNSLQWWEVRVSETGLVGWTTEGDHESFWLIACESKENCVSP